MLLVPVGTVFGMGIGIRLVQARCAVSGSPGVHGVRNLGPHMVGWVSSSNCLPWPLGVVHTNLYLAFEDRYSES